MIRMNLLSPRCDMLRAIEEKLSSDAKFGGIGNFVGLIESALRYFFTPFSGLC